MKKKKSRTWPHDTTSRKTKLYQLLEKYPIRTSVIADAAKLPRMQLYNITTRLGLKNYDTAKRIYDALRLFNVPVKSVMEIID